MVKDMKLNIIEITSSEIEEVKINNYAGEVIVNYHKLTNGKFANDDEEVCSLDTVVRDVRLFVEDAIVEINGAEAHPSLKIK